MRERRSAPGRARAFIQTCGVRGRYGTEPVQQPRRGRACRGVRVGVILVATARPGAAACGTERALSPSQLRNWSGFAVVVAMAGILIATLTPLDGTAAGCPLGVPCLAWHAALFGLLGVAAAMRYATSEAARRSPRRVLGMVVLAMWVLAAGTEIGQGWVTGRDPQLIDWVADMAGALAGLFLGSAAMRWVLARL